MTSVPKNAGLSAGSTGSSLVKSNLRLGSAIAGALVLGALFPSAAWAQNQCGAPQDGTVTCSPDNNPYNTGIQYAPAEDLTIVLGPDVVVAPNGTVSGVVLQSGAQGAVTAQTGATINSNGSGIFVNTAGTTVDNGATITAGTRGIGAYSDNDVTVNNTGAITVDADRSTANFASAIAAGSDFGPVSVTNSGAITLSGSDRFSNGIIAQTFSGASAIDIANSGDIALATTGVNGYSNAIFAGAYASGDGSTVITNSGDLTVASANTARGIAAFNYNDGGVTIDNSGDIDVTGANAHGIIVESGGSALPSDVSISSSGNISVTSTTGGFAAGVRANTLGSLAIDVANVTAMGNATQGIFGRADGDITVVADTVSTFGDNSNAVDLASNSGSIDLTVGDVSTSGSLSGGVRAIGGLDGDVSVTTGNVTTTGLAGSNYSFLPNSTAIVATANGTGNVTVDAGDISTAGLGAVGVNASAATGNTSVSTGAVATTGSRANGISASSYDGDVAVASTGTISTVGDTSAGVYAVARNGGVMVDVADVTTEGFNSRGINAIGGAGGVDVGFDSVTTNGTFSSGVSAISTGGDVAVSGADITTNGTSSYALYASSDVGDVSVDSTGTISSTGRGATGVVATSGTGDVSVNVNNVSVIAANDADTDTTRGAIYASGANANVVVSGSAQTTGSAIYGGSANAVTVVATAGDADVSVNDVSTTGDNADAVNVSATGMATVDANGTITTEGTNSRGLFVRAGTDATITGTGSTATAGDDSNAIDVATTDGSIDIAQGDVSTAGNRSQAVRAIAGGAGDVTLNLGDVSTTGTEAASFFFLPNSTAVFARAGDGMIDITTGDVSTVAGGARGVDAQANGDVSVATGSVTTIGDRANGINATSYAGDVMVSSTGTVSTAGDQSYGIYAVARNGGVMVDAADVATTGFASDGITAIGGIGGVDVGFGSVSAQGTFADGVVATATDGDVVVSGSDVNVGGAASSAIYASATGGDTTVTTTGSVTSTGRGGSGIYAYSDTGTATVNANNVSTVSLLPDDRATSRAAIVATGANAVVTSTGTVTTAGVGLYGGSGTAVQVTGTAGSASATVNNVNTSGAGANAVLVNATGGTAQATVNGTVRTTGATTDAVVVTSDQNVKVANNGSIGATGNGILATSATGSTIVNAGVLTGQNYALQVVGGPASVTNSGRLQGRILLTDANDTFVNTGKFTLTANSDFGAGNDSFTNNGTITTNLSEAGTVGFLNLEMLTNGGLIDLRNGRVGDMFSTSGNYVGTGGQLGVDVQLSNNTADKLVIGGSATGSTSVLVNLIGATPITLGTNTTIVQTGIGSSAGAFTLANGQVDQGLIQLGITYNAANQTFNLVSTPGAAVFRTGAFAGSVRNLWLQSADAWSGHMRELRDNIAANGVDGSGGRLWAQAYGQKEEFDRSRAITTGGTTAVTNIGNDQDYFGGQFGADFGGASGNEGGFAFGVTAGYLNSRVGFDGSADRIDYDVVNGGLYAAYTSGVFFVNALGKYDYYWGDNRSASGRYTTNMNGSIYGGKIEAGARLGGSVWIEPAASLAYTHVNMDDFAVTQGQFRFDADDGLRGKAGARIGTTFANMGATKVQLYVGGNYVHEFSGRDNVTFISGGQTVAFTNARMRDYGEGTLGLNIGSDAGAISGFFEGNYATGGDYRGYGARAGIRFRF